MELSIKELIQQLQKIKNQDKPVYIYDNSTQKSYEIENLFFANDFIDNRLDIEITTKKIKNRKE